MGKYKKSIQLSLFGFVLLVVIYTVATSVFSDEGAPPEVGQQLPQFDAELLSGGTLQLEAYEGRPLVINFWGTFCPPCVEETPALQRLYEKYQDQGVELIGINLGEQPIVRIEQFVNRFDVTYPIVLDPELRIRDKYGVRSYPTTFFIDRTGTIQEIKVGGMTEGFIESRILMLLKQAD